MKNNIEKSSASFKKFYESYVDFITDKLYKHIYFKNNNLKKSIVYYEYEIINLENSNSTVIIQKVFLKFEDMIIYKNILFLNNNITNITTSKFKSLTKANRCISELIYDNYNNTILFYLERFYSNDEFMLNINKTLKLNSIK